MRIINGIEYYEPKDFVEEFGMTPAGVVQILKRKGLGRLFFSRWVISKEDAVKLRELANG